MKFVSAPIYNRVTQAALIEGLDPKQLVLHSLPEGNVPEKAYLPIDHLLKMYELGEEAIGNGFALKAGQSLMIDDYRTLGLSMKTAWSVRDLLLRVVRFLIVITNKGDFELKDQGAQTHFLINNRPVHRKGQAISNEVSLIVLLKIIREVTGKHIAPYQVKWRHTAPKELQAYFDFFGCEVLFNQTENVMCFHTLDMDTPIIKADKSVHNFIVERLEEEKEGIEQNPSGVVRDIENLIIEALPSGTPSVVEIGEHLGMSRRTLTRKLSEFGLSFRDLVKKTQEELTKDLLQSPNLSMGEIAFQAGFSDQSAFNKAFKRWTGQSPTDYRSGLSSH